MKHKCSAGYYTKCNIAGPSNWICRNIFKLCQTESKRWLIFTNKGVKLFTPLGAGTSGAPNTNGLHFISRHPLWRRFLQLEFECSHSLCFKNVAYTQLLSAIELKRRQNNYRVQLDSKRNCVLRLN